MPRLQSAHLRRFKRIDDAPLDFGAVDVLVGANNSGKSSLIQGLHFGIAVLQTIMLRDKKIGAREVGVLPTEMIYSPAESVFSLALGGRLREDKSAAITVGFSLDTGESCEVSIRKGRNRNLLVAVENPKVAEQLASLEHPFTIFSPCLAGISKSEAYMSDGVLLRTTARGDANLVLRNILYRLTKTDFWQPFISDITQIFPSLDIRVQYNDKSDESLLVEVTAGSSWVPIDLAGTGILQSIQILSYIHMFRPSLIVLDEPDSHLHPNNQRLLCSLLQSIAEERHVQILLTTHSRHVVDSLAGVAHLLWARNATIDAAGQDDEIGILLDIGALDIKERVGVAGTKVVVLTEDTNTSLLNILLESSGIIPSETTIISYHGTTQIKNLRPLVNIIKATNPKARLLLHRDRDFLEDVDVSDWTKNVQSLGVEAFVTSGTDVESHFVNAEYLARMNNRTAKDVQTIISQATEERTDALIESYVNGFVNSARQNGTHPRINPGALAALAPKAITSSPQRWCHGKTLLAGVRDAYKRQYGVGLQAMRADVELAIPQLQAFAKKAFGQKKSS